MTKPEGPAQEPHGKRLMRLPPNPNYPGYVGAHTEDDWCAKAGCIPMCVPATPAPSQPAGAREWDDDPTPQELMAAYDRVCKERDTLAQQTAAKDAQVESYHDVTEANRVQSLRANFCDKHREICECSTGPCVMCGAAALREENARLKGALEKYGQHALWCGSRRPEESRTGTACTCGYATALSSSPAQEQKK